MKREFVVVSSLILVLASHLAYSRSISGDVEYLVSDGDGDGGRADSGSSRSFLQWRLSATTVTCEPIYGFLPCSTNAWGLLFLVVVYEVLLSIAAQFIANGSTLFLQIIGPGVFGANVFQFLGTIPQLGLVLGPILTGSVEKAQERATVGISMVIGGVAMLLTLAWGLTVIIGSYHLSEEAAPNDSKSQETITAVKAAAGTGVVTDVQTSWTARLIFVATVPFFILELQNVFPSSSGRRIVLLITFIVTIALLIGYILFQSFQPWIQNRCFEYMMDKNVKDKLLKLVTKNGRPDTPKIQKLFNKIAKDNNASITAAEVRVLVLGVKIDDDDTSTDLDLDNIMTYFDTSSDGVIDHDEFIKGMTNLASNLLDQTPAQTTKGGDNNSQIIQQGLLASTSTSQTATNSWSLYLRATFLVIFGTLIACLLGDPLIDSVIEFAEAADISFFWVSYMALPLAVNYDVLIQSIASATQKTQKSNSLTLSSLYGGVFMNNMIGLIIFLAAVYFRNLSSDANAELVVSLVICIIMGIFTSFNTTFPRWTGYLVLLLYPISIVAVYVLTSVFGWS